MVAFTTSEHNTRREEPLTVPRSSQSGCETVELYHVILTRTPTPISALNLLSNYASLHNTGSNNDNMLFNKIRNHSDDPENSTLHHKQEKPLSCMIFFFASQMLSNLEPPAASSESTDKARILPTRAHRLDVLLAEVGEHANCSPYVTRFEPIPVEMSPPGRPTGTSCDEMHDVLLLASFKDKRAWQKWIETPEWQRFMQRTENEGVFRRLPHVRCAHSLKGLRNTLEVLTA